MNYYNDNDPFKAAWLRQLIGDRLIPYGEVDERSISDVTAGDLSGFTQWHFFAGIGGWSYALELASWPEDRPVATASCPCQLPLPALQPDRQAARYGGCPSSLARILPTCSRSPVSSHLWRTG